MINSVNKN